MAPEITTVSKPKSSPPSAPVSVAFIRLKLGRIVECPSKSEIILHTGSANGKPGMPEARYNRHAPMHKTRSLRFAFASVLATALLSEAAVVSAQTPQWKSFGSPSDGFRALFPSDPQVT